MLISDYANAFFLLVGKRLIRRESSGTSPNFLITLGITEIACSRVTRAAERNRANVTFLAATTLRRGSRLRWD